MSQDGLIPAAFGKLHPKFQTPYIANWMLFIFVGAFAALVPGSVAGDLTSFGTLFAFILVCLGILIMRKSNPELKRPFKTPLVPIVPVLGILVCTAMIVSLDIATLQAAALWMGLGLIIYFSYSRKNSHLHPKK
jgi:APA family basic amino acid/polyamine antiporter